MKSKDTDSLPSKLLLSSSSEDNGVYASIMGNDDQAHQVSTKPPPPRVAFAGNHIIAKSKASDARSTPGFIRRRKRSASGEALRDVDANTALGEHNDIKRIKRATDRGDSTVDSPTKSTDFNRHIVPQRSHASTSDPREYYDTTAEMAEIGDRSTSTLVPMETRTAFRPIMKAKSLALSSSMVPKNTRTLRPVPSSSTRITMSRDTVLPITRPLRIQPLRSILSPNNRRNSVVDVLAVITFVSPHVVTPPRLPPKRDLRLLDPSCPSTRQPVLFSVFVDPNHFRPAVGTVALFRSVTTHEWNGGSLNAYDKDCAGRKWYLPNPVGVDGCDIQGLKDYYKQWLAEEQKKEAERELLKELELEERQRQGPEAKIM